jgi:peroxiredoxin
MIRNSLFLFFILTVVWAGLCSAQTTEKKYYLVNGLFFDGMPPGVSWDNASTLIDHQDEAGHKAIELRLRKGFELPEEVKKYATPVEEVPGAEALLMSSRGELGKKMPVGVVPTMKREEWLGKLFPDFKVTDTEGKVWTNADIAGQPLVLNFWHIGCGPCINEMPELNKWMEIFPNMTYWATTFNTAEQIKKIVENRPFRFTQIADELFFFKTFKVSGMPVTILVDKKGIIRWIEDGTSNAKLRYLQDKLKELSVE